MPSMSGHQLPNRGKTFEWYTPPKIFAALGMWFDLDPCFPVDKELAWIPATYTYTQIDNGLMMPWRGHVWLNPPYGSEVGAWLGRLAAHGDGIALLFARTDTKWFHDFGALADAICFLKGRPHFIQEDGNEAPYNCGAPLILLGYGARCARAVEQCGLGFVMIPQKQVRKVA